MSSGTFDDRKSQRLLATPLVGMECRAFIDDHNNCVIVWWDRDANTGEWTNDQGAKIPPQARTSLAEFLVEHLS